MNRRLAVAALCLSFAAPSIAVAQGVTTAAISGIITDQDGSALSDATVTALHVPSGTSYRAVSRAGGAYAIPGMRVGGPYTITVNLIGHAPSTERNIDLSLGQNRRLDFRLQRQAVTVEGITAVAEDEVMNADRTGAATFIGREDVLVMPSIKRSTRDLTRIDPRSDGNYSFGGRNWLYNNISLDGSYFNNSFGLDDPAPGGQANAEPLPYDAVEQVQVSIAPFDVRQGGFTGANVNIVTRSGTNLLSGSVYGFTRNESFQGNKVRGNDVTANPSLGYTQAGFAIGGPIMRDRLFFFLNAEFERTEDPGTNFSASTTGGQVNGSPAFGESRVTRAMMDSIRSVMLRNYSYDTGPYEGYTFNTNNNKLLLRLDWNLGANSNLMVRYNYLDAMREQGPHPFVLSFANAGRGPNTSTLPFRNSGYAINNDIHSLAMEWNKRGARSANRLFFSYNRNRDRRDPFSEPFPTIDIGEGGVGYTTLGHEPFSIHNILSTDVFQLTNNFSLYRGRHNYTFGGTLESFKFFNSFNIFRHGVFFLPYGLFPGTSTFADVDDFFNAANPGPSTGADFRSFVGTGPYKGEEVHSALVALYAQDEFLMSDRLQLTYGLRVDLPMYLTDPVANPFSTGLTALDENRQPEVVDQARLPGTQVMISPRIGFNYNARGDRSTQIRGGTGIFTGRIPFVWFGNVISNPGANPNIWGPFNTGPAQVSQGSPGDSSILQQSFDLNAVVEDFKWPQVWTTDFAVDHRLMSNLLGTFEVTYTKDLQAIYVRNADLPAPTATNPVDGRPVYPSPELNADGGAGIYVLDNTNDGRAITLTAQLRRPFSWGNASLSYTFTDAKNNLKSTEIASVLWQNQPVQGDPNNPELANSEFGHRHRIIGTLSWSRSWSERFRTQVGLFLEMGQGNRFAGAGGNRYSFIYSGDVNGDGYGGNDLIYVPTDATDPAEILFDPCATNCGANTTAPQQAAAFEAFINQDNYLSSHRGQIAERFGALNPWYTNVDLRVLQDIGLRRGATNTHRLQVSIDILNLGNLISSSWGVRKVADPRATSPLTLTGFTAGQPRFNFTGPASTYVDDPSILSRWRMQFGLRYMFN